MSFVQRAVDRVLHRESAAGESAAGESAAARVPEYSAQLQNLQVLSENLSAALELAIDNEGWQETTAGADKLFSNEQRLAASKLARLMYIKHPLIKRAVDAQSHYVWGQGVGIEARHPELDKVIQAFLDDKENEKEITEHKSQLQKEVELQTDGNIFFAFFINQRTGRVRTRTIPHGQITQVITDPEDKKKPWFYKREWTRETVDMATGETRQEKKVAYYPDWEYSPFVKSQRRIGKHKIEWTIPVYHVKAGAFSDSTFGLSEIFAALNWAKAYREFLEDRASVARALSTFAWKGTGENAKGLARFVAQLSSKAQQVLGQEARSAPEGQSGFRTGSTLLTTKDTEMAPVKTSGATINPDEGRRFLLMVAAAVGLPETFFGDVSVGTLATAQSLARPTELMMGNRQQFWQGVLMNILQFVIDWAIRAPQGPLRGTVTMNDEGERVVQIADDAATGKPMDRHIQIIFPRIVEPDPKAEIEAIDLSSKFLPDAKLIARLILQALRLDDIDEVLETMFDENGNPLKPFAGPPPVVDGDDEDANGGGANGTADKDTAGKGTADTSQADNRKAPKGDK